MAEALGPPVQPFISPSSPKYGSPPPEDSMKQETSLFAPDRLRDSGIEESLLESVHQQRRLSISECVIKEAAEDEGRTSLESSGSNRGFLASHGSNLPVSPHDSSVYSSDNAEGRGEGGYVMAKQERRKGKRAKSSSENSEEDASENSFTTTHTLKWFTASPNKLNKNKSLKATVSENRKKKNTKLKTDIQILPNVTEPNGDKVAKMIIGLTVKNSHECTAVVDISLRDSQTQDLITQTQETRHFTDGFIQFFTTLGPQERIDSNINKLLDIIIEVKLLFKP